jgi:catechol 2,3-dioxygenase-like lactoylglutathione lyase family enzyme
MQLRLADYIVLVVEDLDRALAFYCGTLGLRLGHRRGPYAQLATGATRLAIYTREAMEGTLGTRLERPGPEATAFELARCPTWMRLMRSWWRPGCPP